MAVTRCTPTGLSRVMGVAHGRIQTSGAASDVTPKPLLNTPSNRSIQVKNSPGSQDDTSVYRYYDTHGLLIYVGITSRGIARNREHNASKEWWPFVTRQEVEHFPTRAHALKSESGLIGSHRPPFNKHHNPDHAATRAAYLAFATAPTQPLTADEKRRLRKNLPLVAIQGAEGELWLRTLPDHHEVIRDCVSNVYEAGFPSSPPLVSSQQRKRAGHVAGIDYLGSTLVIRITGKYLPTGITEAHASIKAFQQKPLAWRIERVFLHRVPTMDGGV